MLKTIGDLAEANQTPPSEVELLAAHDAIADALRDAMGKLADCRSKMVAGISPQGRAVLEAMGQKLTKNIGRLEEQNLAVQRDLIAARHARGMIAKRNGIGDLESDVRKLREHSQAVLSGKVVVPADVRSRLAKALSLAEVALAEAVR